MPPKRYATGSRQGGQACLALQNAETIKRLVEQGEFLLKSFHEEHQKDPEELETEFARGELIGWRSTLHTMYRDCAEDIVNRVITRTRLTIPDGEVPSGTTHAIEVILHQVEQLHDVSERLAILADQHPLVSEALMTISGTVRNTATILGVLIATKMTRPI